MDPNLTTESSSRSAPASATTRARPPVEAVDLDRANRPGVPKERPPEPWPNSRPTPARMTAPSAVPKHGRPNKPMTPVYATSVPPRGLSGAIRRAAYRLPDHYVNHWLLLLFADRVQSWGRRAQKLLRMAPPAVALAFLARRVVRGRG